MKRRDNSRENGNGPDKLSLSWREEAFHQYRQLTVCPWTKTHTWVNTAVLYIYSTCVEDGIIEFHTQPHSKTTVCGATHHLLLEMTGDAATGWQSVKLTDLLPACSTLRVTEYGLGINTSE